MIVHTARVSNPKSQQEGNDPGRLIRYLIKHQHWSPFEMASACIEINTTRDIARQILRHRSFSFQEFSQRYASVDALHAPTTRTARLQDTANRQNSIEVDDPNLQKQWQAVQEIAHSQAMAAYEWALNNGIAKEVARAVLPEGLTPSRMYMNGTIRSWIHYLSIRTGPETQQEHREVAQAILWELYQVMPGLISEALYEPKQ